MTLKVAVLTLFASYLARFCAFAGPYVLFTGLFLLPLALHAQDESDQLFSVLGEEVQEILPDSIQAFTWLEETVAVFKDEAGDTSFEEVLMNDQWFGENFNTTVLRTSD